MSRKARGPHATVFERDTYDLPKRVSLPCRGVGAVELWPTGYGGTRPALRQSTTTQPRQVRTARLLARAPWAVGPCVTERKARGPRATGFERGVLELSKPVPSACRCVGAVEPRPTRWEERPPRWATTQPRQVCTARHVRSVRGRPIHHRAKSERAARLKMQMRYPAPSKPRAADVSLWWCGRAWADGMRRSAPRLGPQHNRAKSAQRCVQLIRGRSAATPRGKKPAGRAAQNSNVICTTFRTLCRRPVAVFTRSSVDR